MKLWMQCLLLALVICSSSSFAKGGEDEFFDSIDSIRGPGFGFDDRGFEDDSNEEPERLLDESR